MYNDKMSEDVDTILNDSQKWYNVPNTSGDKASDGKSWLSHWENVTECDATRCSVIGCDYVSNGSEDKQNNLVGGHVRNHNDTTKCIVPLCKSCNNESNDTFFYLEEQAVSIKEIEERIEINELSESILANEQFE